MTNRNVKGTLLVPSSMYVRARRRYEAKRRRLEAQLEACKQELEELGNGPFWFERLVKPIAKALAGCYPDRRYEILGPFGLSCEATIHLYRKDVPEDEKLVGDNCLSITFIPGDLEKGELYIRDYRRKTGDYPKNSLGDINGMNYASVPIPAHADLDWLVQWVR